MRLLILSDSHGDTASLRRILRSQPDAQALIFCGDGEEDLKTILPDFPNITAHMVKGNGDWSAKLPLMRTIELCEKRIFMAHGHTYGVKGDDSDIIFAAKQEGCHILCYGHTHIARSDYIDGMYIVNPGSCSGFRGSFAAIDITNGGIVPIILQKDKIPGL